MASSSRRSSPEGEPGRRSHLARIDAASLPRQPRRRVAGRAHAALLIAASLRVATAIVVDPFPEMTADLLTGAMSGAEAADTRPTSEDLSVDPHAQTVVMLLPLLLLATRPPGADDRRPRP